MTTSDQDESGSVGRIEELIEQSSLGAPAARKLRSRISPAEARRIVGMAGQPGPEKPPADDRRQPPVTGDDRRAAGDTRDELAATEEQTAARVRDEVASFERKALATIEEQTARELRVPGPDHPSTLSPRDREIARLIAQGLSNQDIAKALLISPATVTRLVASLMTKLNVRSRAQVAAWVVDTPHTARGESAGS